MLGKIVAAALLTLFVISVLVEDDLQKHSPDSPFRPTNVLNGTRHYLDHVYRQIGYYYGYLFDLYGWLQWLPFKTALVLIVSILQTLWAPVSGFFGGIKDYFSYAAAHLYKMTVGDITGFTVLAIVLGLAVLALVLRTLNRRGIIKIALLTRIDEAFFASFLEWLMSINIPALIIATVVAVLVVTGGLVFSVVLKHNLSNMTTW